MQKTWERKKFCDLRREKKQLEDDRKKIAILFQESKKNVRREKEKIKLYIFEIAAFLANTCTLNSVANFVSQFFLLFFFCTVRNEKSSLVYLCWFRIYYFFIIFILVFISLFLFFFLVNFSNFLWLKEKTTTEKVPTINSKLHKNVQKQKLVM